MLTTSQTILVFLVMGLLILAGWVFGTRRDQRSRVSKQDLLKRLYQLEECHQPADLSAFASKLKMLQSLRQQGLLSLQGTTVHLTQTGREQARELVRGHRLLETHLAERTGHHLRDFHANADRIEHRLTAAEIEELDRALGYPVQDPHGDLIPRVLHPLEPTPRLTLDLWPAGSKLKVIHLEDEPDQRFQELLQAGIQRGSELEVVENQPQYLQLRLAGQGSVRLGAAAAANVDVVPSQADPHMLEKLVSLDRIETGHKAKIILLSAALRGIERRRLLDLGFTPGAVVQPVLSSAFGDPMAYAIRRSRVALRRDQTRHILVLPLEEG